MPPTVDYILGVDLGKKRDPTSLVLLERDWSAGDHILDVRYIKMLPLETKYTEVKNFLSDFAQHEWIKNRIALAVDLTGVGQAVLDVLRDDNFLQEVTWGIQITGGRVETQKGMNWNIPKTNLVASVQVMLQSQRLRCNPNIDGARDLRKQMAGFTATITKSNNVEFGNDVETKHDDLVSALCCGVWLANFLPPMVAVQGGSTGFAPYQAVPGHQHGQRHNMGRYLDEWRG